MKTEREIRKITANRYERWKPLRGYAIGKLALDPAYPEVAARLRSSPHPLMDVGCGMGLLAAYLKEHGHNGAGIGIDADGKKIGIAEEALRDVTPRMDFRVGDARELPDFSGDVVMLDVLHYFDAAGQREVLQAIANRLAPGAAALIRIGLRQRNWRYAVTWLEEWFIRLNGWIPVRGTNFPTREDVIAPFDELGFICKCEPMWGLTPFNSHLFEFRRPA